MKNKTLNLFLLAIILGLTISAKAQLSQDQPCHYSNGSGNCLDWHTPSSHNVVGALDQDPAYDYLGTYGNDNCPYEQSYISAELACTAFYFTIPSNATITGIKAYFVKKASTSGVVKDLKVMLCQGGSAIGVNKKKDTYWNSSYTTTTYGTSYSLWGTSLTPAQVNSNSFGVVLKCANMDHYSGHGVYVDYCSITIYYRIGLKLMSQERMEITNEEINIYPNPVSSILNINSNQEINNTNIRVIDIAGKVVFEQNGTDLNQIEQTQIDISALSTGTYFLEVLAGDKKRTKKFIKR